MENEIFLGVMELNEATQHQLRLKDQGVAITFKTNGTTCTTGCKVTVEVYGEASQESQLLAYFRSEFAKNVKGHEPNLEALSAVFDDSLAEAMCQACGLKFSTKLSECPDCGLCY